MGDEPPKTDWYREVSEPALLLAGTISQKNIPEVAIESFESVLPDVQTVILEGHGHGAHGAAPDLVTREVADFLLEKSH